MLDMEPYTAAGITAREKGQGSTPQQLYELTGIIVHQGQASAGHYYAFIKHKKWATIVSPSSCLLFVVSIPLLCYHFPSHPQFLFSSVRDFSFLLFSPSPLFQVFLHSFFPSPHLCLAPSLFMLLWQCTEVCCLPPCTSITHVYFIWHLCSRNPDSGVIEEEEVDDSHLDSRWLKFNDTIVEEFAMTDSALEAECFGGSIKTSSTDPRELAIGHCKGCGQFVLLIDFHIVTTACLSLLHHQEIWPCF